MSQQPIALLCFLYPSSDSTQSRILSLLSTASTTYYNQPKSLCTTWNYFTPSQRPKAPFQPLSPSFSLSPCSSTSSVPLPLVIAGIEIYSSKDGLSIQQKESFFKDYEETVKKEDLYARDEEMSVWYPRGGFISRDAKSTEKGNPLLARFEAKSASARDSCVEVLSEFCAWVMQNEPGTLTYTVMTRPDSKGSTEVIMYERYRDLPSFKAHGGSKEFKAMFKKLMPHIDPKATKMAEWEEIEAGFVGHGFEGVGGEREKAKL